MSQTGFMINRLALTGPGRMDAELSFRNGLNVITGPSDTGKTFVFKCIDFMLGASTPPKEIPQSEGYDTIRLELQDCKNESTFSLIRSLKGGPFKFRIDGKNEKVLKEKHKAGDDETLSYWLLGLTGLQDKRLLKKKTGETRSFSFRDMAHLSLISEEEIIKETSPIFSGQRTDITVEKSIFRLLLSGTDDSSIVQAPDTKEIRKRFEAKSEVLEDLIEKTKKKIEESQNDNDSQALDEQLRRLDSSICQLTESLNEEKEAAEVFETTRRTKWTDLTKMKSRLEVLSELQTRFLLLHEQYESDIRRLDAISESGQRLDEMRLEYCPVCGAPADSHDQEHQECQTDPLAIAQSCSFEVAKIKSLIADLKKTRDDVQDEIREIETAKLQTEKELYQANTHLQEQLNPRIKSTLQELHSLQVRRESVKKTISLFEQMSEYEEIRNGFQEQIPEKSEKVNFSETSDRYLENFSKEVQKRLKKWGFPNLDRVTFDKSDWDVIISGQPRKSHGKGVRAVTHAAFTLSLLRYCRDKRLPHSGSIILDSPLVVYREPDAGEESFSQDVKSSFFHDLADSFQDSQVIIIENDPPPDDLESNKNANIIRFTGTNTGRSGFIPAQRESNESGTS